MARHKTLRKHTRRHRTRKNNGFIKKGLNTGITTVKKTSKKYMPSVKSGLEQVGSKVTKTATRTIPVLQKKTRDLFSIIGIKKGKK
jgi:hypothetical protein